MDKTIRKILSIVPGFKLKLYVLLKSIIFPFSSIEQFVPRAGEIIEIGCSYGLTTVYLALKSDRRRVIGTDNNRKRIECARRAWNMVPDVNFRLSNLLDRVKIKEKQTILAIDLLHHIPFEEQNLFLSSCYKRFDNTNLLIIKEIDKKPFFKFLLNYVGDLLMNSGKFYFSSSRIMKRELEYIGFDVKYNKIEHPLYPHYILICRKR